MCPELTPPDNGFVLFPCTREESHTCSVVCAHGYSISGSPQQTCQLDPVSKTLSWSEPPTCHGSDPCSPNPCLHDGVCISAGSEFSCDCSDTKYTGPICNIGIILLPPIPILTKGQTYDITVSTSLDITNKLLILLFVNGRPLQPLIILQPHRPTDTLRYTPNRAGIHTITHRHKPQHLFEIQPSKVTFLVRETSEQTTPNNYYFTTLGLRVGQLKEGCCLPQDQLSFSCPESTQQVIFKAACQWNNDVTSHWAPGVIFAAGQNLSLPLSVAGYQYSQNSEGSVLSTTLECTPCSSKEPVCMEEAQLGDCYCYNFTEEDTQDFLNTNALGMTYIEQIQSLLPTWLNLQANLTSTSTYLEQDIIAPIVQSHTDVQAVEGCHKITPMHRGIYSILRYDKILSGGIDGITYTYDGNRDKRGSNDPMCFAVNLCQGFHSPVFFQLSQPVQDILVFEHLQSFNRMGWHIQLRTVTVSRNDMNYITDQTYIWNGQRMILSPLIIYDISVNTNSEAMFQSESLSVRVAFIGDITFQYQTRRGILRGKTTLIIQSRISNEEQNLLLTSARESFFSIPDGSSCSRGQGELHGISFKARYKPLAGEYFFSHLMTLTEVTQECPFNVFIPIDRDYTAHGLSMHTECPLLSLGQLNFTKMSHVMNIIGSTSDCFQDDFLAVPDPALVIHSKLRNEYLPLGQFLELQRRRDGDDMTVVFGKNQEGFVAILHSVKVSVLGSSFIASARIENNILEISGNTTISQHPTNVHITALVNETNWNQLSFATHGNVYFKCHNVT